MARFHPKRRRWLSSVKATAALAAEMMSRWLWCATVSWCVRVLTPAMGTSLLVAILLLLLISLSHGRVSTAKGTAPTEFVSDHRFYVTLVLIVWFREILELSVFLCQLIKWKFSELFLSIYFSEFYFFSVYRTKFVLKILNFWKSAYKILPVYEVSYKNHRWNQLWRNLHFFHAKTKLMNKLR